ncbi:MAG: hypothetical protein NVS3B21_14790 [Acidimicrobiales bacterium]
MPALFRSLPRFTKIAGATGLSIGLALGGYGVAQAASGAAPSSGAAGPGTTPPARGPRVEGGGRLAAAARALAMTPAELMTQLQGGKSIADVARSKNIDPSVVIDAMVTDAQAHLKERITAEVNHPFAPGGRKGFGHERGANLASVASALGLPEATIRSELMGGKSLAQIAQAHGSTADAVIGALVAERTSQIDSRVAAGTLTQAQADTMKAALKDRVAAMVNHVPAPGGPGRFGHSEDDRQAPAASPQPAPGG